jgi:phosphatidylglycerophosphate synthase
MKNTPESPQPPIRIVKSTYYSNWGDRIGYPLAKLTVKPLSRLNFLTPNHVTLISFLSFAVGCLLLDVNIPFHLPIAALLIFAGYVGDDVDGQLARITGKFSVLGDYLDKVLDILKIFLVTLAAGVAEYFQTRNPLYLILGFVACFMFQYRYYIKLETMFSAISRDPEYLDASSVVRKDLEYKMDILYSTRAQSFSQGLRLFWIKNRTILFVDEAEFAIFVAIGAVTNHLAAALWLIAMAQVIFVTWRLFERGSQLASSSPNLKQPLRK